MLRIGIIIGSTRPGRKGEAVAKWVYEIAQKRSDSEFEILAVDDDAFDPAHCAGLKLIRTRSTLICEGQGHFDSTSRRVASSLPSSRIMSAIQIAPG